MATTDFGHALRRWRDRVTPEAAGLPVGGHRRAAGLRREELAQLAGLVPPGQGTVPAFITLGVQRMLDRLTATPVAVFDAAGTQLMASPLYTALMGEHRGNERNAVWRNFLGSGSRVRHTPESLRDLQTAQAAMLRAAAGRYPADQSVRRLVAELRSTSVLSPNCGIPAP